MSFPDLFRTIYLLGSTGLGHEGHVLLRADGSVIGPSDVGRARWRLTGDRFEFFDAHGAPQVRLRWRPETNVFFPDDRWSLYMLPLVTLSPAEPPMARARLLVNTIPKSGTYLLDLVLAQIGYRGAGLHLLPLECHDNRGIPPALIHCDPFSRRAFAPAAMVARALGAGEFALGHIPDLAQLRVIQADGVGMINCRRDLRDVLASLYHFKRKSVDAIKPSERLWRQLSGPAGFMAYLCAVEPELERLGEFATMMPDLPGVALRYEDLVQGIVPPKSRDALDALDDDLGAIFEAVLPQCLGRESSTLSGGRVGWQELWNDAVEDFFDRTGLRAANQAMGYR